MCVLDDVFAMLRAFFPLHVEWSSVVQNSERTRHPQFPWLLTLNGDEDATIVDCHRQGFDDQLDAYFWASKKIGWTEVSAIVEWPLVTLWSRARRKRARWREIELTPLIDDCGNLVAIGVVPVVVLSLFFYVAVSFMTVPFVRAGARAISRAKDSVVYFFLFVLELYNH